MIFGVVVGVHRYGQARLFEVTEEIGQTGVEPSLQIEGGEMKVACLREEVEIEVGDG